MGAYYLGAFRNNYVDDRPEKRYRELESFPGFDIDEIAVHRFAKLTGELNKTGWLASLKIVWASDADD